MRTKLASVPSLTLCALREIFFLFSSSRGAFLRGHARDTSLGCPLDFWPNFCSLKLSRFMTTMKNLKIRSSILWPENLSEKFKNIENEIFIFTFLKNPFSFFVENLVTQKWNFHFRFNKNRDFLTTPDYDKYLKKVFEKLSKNRDNLVLHGVWVTKRSRVSWLIFHRFEVANMSPPWLDIFVALIDLPT